MEEQLVKYFSGNLSRDEARKIEEWRSESDKNASEFLEYHLAWKFSNEQEVNKSAALNAVMNRIEAIEGANEELQGHGFKTYLKYAAIAVLGIGLMFFGKDKILDSGNQIAIEASENLEIITLPDGSVVTLSQNSVLTYNEKFDGETRNVDLQGKAFFDIRRDETKPFIVNTDKSKIEVLGTSFLVNTLAMNSSTEVIVKTGKVAVSKKKSKVANTVQLVAGEVGRLVEDAVGFEKSTIEDYNYLAWKTKLVEFEDQDLQSVLGTLEEVYGVKISVSNEKIHNCKVSAKFDNQPVESVLEILSRTFNLELTKSGTSQFSLSGEGCIVVQ
ncbi:MAG: FecR family protein [Reichenbachiella sp.]|uniref:FecR family protein n=1 Tax=Reichenbachiella sp. TaxID=2184521 RepID=UPI0029660C72|nr:FecR family protein [Reichenbachiella sp.]MDW3211181.1 FecR family protein [Reichenbachiella sp.]